MPHSRFIALSKTTGSIGVQVLNAVRRHPNSFKIVALAADNNSNVTEALPYCGMFAVYGDYLNPFRRRKFCYKLAAANQSFFIIWQCLGYDRKASFKKLIITASGGAFRGYTAEQLEKVLPAFMAFMLYSSPAKPLTALNTISASSHSAHFTAAVDRFDSMLYSGVVVLFYFATIV